MKKLITLSIAILLAISAQAQDKYIEAVTGGYIYHLYCGTNDDLIGQETTKLRRSLTAPMVGVRYVEEYLHQHTSYSLFFTENCIGKRQIGFVADCCNKENFGRFNFIYGFCAGFYTENGHDWNDKNMNQKPVMLFKCITPIVGVEVNLRYHINQKYYVSVNTIASLIIHTSVGVRININ